MVALESGRQIQGTGPNSYSKALQFWPYCFSTQVENAPSLTNDLIDTTDSKHFQ